MCFFLLLELMMLRRCIVDVSATFLTAREISMTFDYACTSLFILCYNVLMFFMCFCDVFVRSRVTIAIISSLLFSIQCFDTVGWATRRAPVL